MHPQGESMITGAKCQPGRRMCSDYGLIGLLVTALSLSVAACTRIQEPWVNNDEQWKEQAFQTKSDDDALRQRLRHTQSDR